MQFMEKRRELKQDGRTEKELSETFCFLLSDAQKVNGLLISDFYCASFRTSCILLYVCHSFIYVIWLLLRYLLYWCDLFAGCRSLWCVRKVCLLAAAGWVCWGIHLKVKEPNFQTKSRFQSTNSWVLIESSLQCNHRQWNKKFWCKKKCICK